MRRAFRYYVEGEGKMRIEKMLEINRRFFLKERKMKYRFVKFVVQCIYVANYKREDMKLSHSIQREEFLENGIRGETKIVSSREELLQADFYSLYFAIPFLVEILLLEIVSI